MNLSRGGLFIRSADPLKPGTRLRIEVEWASTVIPLAEGEVVWARPQSRTHAGGFGVRFTSVASSSRGLIESSGPARRCPGRDPGARVGGLAAMLVT